MIKLDWNKKFEKSLKRYIKKHPEKESIIVEKLLLFADEPFAPELRNHKLNGKLKGLRAIDIERDCRVVFKTIDNKTAMLINIGSHESLFEKLIIEEIPEL
jgi:addiction module RelE/StbE family toxin